MRTRQVALAASATATAAAVVTAVRRRRAPHGLPERRDGRYVTLRGVTINRPPREVYAFWRDFDRVASALGRDATVAQVGERRYAWSVDGPAGRRLSWDAEMILDEPGRVIAWRTDSAPLPHEGRVEFTPAPGDRGTELRVGLTYDLPGGAVAATAAKLTGDEPDQVLRSTLRRIKQLIECGEAITVDGQPSGRNAMQQKVTEFADHKLATGGRA